VLYKYVVKGGLIIIDDYYVWDGCTKAVHDFLSANALSEHIRQSHQGVCYLIKGL
jgi:O-methyltransferase